MEFTWISRSVQQTEQLGERLAAVLSAGQTVALFGTMGMGKTAFVRGIARGLGFRGEVSSPTFALVHEYVGGRLALYHFDMYRVLDWDGLSSCGYYDYLDAGGVLAIEWSENIENALEPDCIRVSFSRGSDTDSRLIHFVGGDCLRPIEPEKRGEGLF